MKFEKIKKLKELINDSENIVIIPHTSPDGDAIGSCLALFNICLLYTSDAADE